MLIFIVFPATELRVEVLRKWFPVFHDNFLKWITSFINNGLALVDLAARGNARFFGFFFEYRSADNVSLGKAKEIKDSKQNNSKYRLFPSYQKYKVFRYLQKEPIFSDIVYQQTRVKTTGKKTDAIFHFMPIHKNV